MSPPRLRHGGLYVKWAVLGFEDDDVVEVNLQVDVKRCLVAKRSCESQEQKEIGETQGETEMERRERESVCLQEHVARRSNAAASAPHPRAPPLRFD